MAVTTFTINGKLYKAADIEYNTIADLEENGVDILGGKEKPLSMLRAYLAVCGNMPVKTAGDELGAHMSNGGDLNELSAVLKKKMDDSGFIKATVKKAKATVAKKETKTES